MITCEKKSHVVRPVLHTKFELQYFIKECSTETKVGTKTLQYLYTNISKNGGNRWFGNLSESPNHFKYRKNILIS